MTHAAASSPARTFTALGHEVLFLVPGEARSAVEEAGFAVHEAPPPDPVEYQQIKDAIAEDPEAAKVLMNRDYFGRLCTEATLPAAEELCATWKPDLVVHEAADYAPPIAAHRAGIPHVQIAIGLAWIEWGCLQTFAAEVLPAPSRAIWCLRARPSSTRRSAASSRPQRSLPAPTACCWTPAPCWSALGPRSGCC